MVNPRHKRLFLAVSYLVWAAMFFRWFSVDRSPGWAENRWIIVPLILYGLLLGLDNLLTRGEQGRVLLYIAAQAGLVFILISQAAHLDYFFFLLLPTIGQAVFLLRGRAANGVVGVLAVLQAIGLAIMQGMPAAISFIVLYSATIIFTMGFSNLMLQADAARRESQRLLQEVQTYSEQARRLAVVEERNRLARELHDSVTQALYGLTLQSEGLARQLDSGQDQVPPEELREIRDTAQRALQEMRLMIFELRPTILQEEGFAAALQARLETVENRSGMQASFMNQFEDRLPPDIEDELYGITREALNNVAKHARATRIEIRLAPESEDRMLLAITDNGAGFDPAEESSAAGLGLKGMRERAENIGATLTVESRTDAGTSIRVEWPR